MAKKLLQNISVPHSMPLIYNIKEIQKTESRYKYYLIPVIPAFYKNIFKY